MDATGRSTADWPNEQEVVFHWINSGGQRSALAAARPSGRLVYGLSLAHPFHVESKNLARFLLQASVIGLGFGMNLHEVIQAGRSGFLYTAFSITAAMLLGLGLGYLIHVSKKASFLISAGTAICGGSAIAAVGPIAGASEEEMAV